MKTILKSIKKILQFALDILARCILALVYFILLFPLGIILRLFTDFLGVRNQAPSWVLRKKIDNIREFLSHQ
jgi:hypothetical protein